MERPRVPARNSARKNRLPPDRPTLFNLYVEQRVGPNQAARHVPAYATALMHAALRRRAMQEVRRGGGKATGGAGGSRGAAGTLQGLAAAALDALFISR